ncbi:TadE family protein [Agrococcus sp. KRD186]|uniref:TadE family protein n=1 Tax=Agrococcus sp. KRD186 TaxID=2729730 RepID=UPI0019D1495D|nr:TadE/TadG family type IV pilus assembly protein [Agrococcus sp. KRD186]
MKPLTWRDRGATAVEFALVVPMLMVMLVGIVSFGFAFHVQTVLDNSARDAVRVFTLTDIDARDAAILQAQHSALPTITLPTSAIDAPATCAAEAYVTVTTRVSDFELLGGLWKVDLIGKGTMRCGG